GMGVVVHHEQRKASVTVDETREETFEWTLPDYGVDGWAFSAQLVANGEQGTDRSTVWFWRYEPWTMREKILISNYWGGDGSVPAAMMPLFAKYHRGIGYSAAHHWREPYLSRFNMRAWYQHGATRMEVFTNNFRTPDFSHLRERVAKNLNRDSRLHSAAWVIRDFGEETGFYYHWSNNPFGRTWKTNEDIPEGAHRFFRMYVQEKYGEVARLNDAWEREFATFDQVELDTRYGYPAGWLYMRPPEQLPANLAPVIDTHGFFFWYTERVAETYTDALRERNPTADWGMSFSLTFNLFSPIPMTMVHPVYNAQVLQAWHNKAIMRSRGGSTPIFSFHWGFDEDARAWGQFWNNSLVSGSTFISNWGSQFNFDLTHSRSTILLKRLMARVKPREKFFLDLYPVDDFDVGIYHPDLDWQTVHSRPRFYLDAQGPNDMAMGQLGYKSTGTGWLGGPEAQMFSLLSASGYTPRFVTEADIPKCRVLVVPYVETMPVTAAARMREMVAAGGMLITMPVIAQYNGNGKPFDTIPGGGLDELLGLTLDPEIVGQRSMVILPHDDEQLPMRFTPRMGSEPPYLWSFGHQHVRSLAENTHVVLRNYENEPMITVHPFGDGQAVHLNAMTFHHWGQYELSEFHEESLRQLLDNLVRAGGVEPALFVERPFRYGTGINDWVQYQYQLKDSDIRVLALYSDKMSQKILGQVVLNEPAAAVYDILNGERMPLRRRGGGQVVEEMEPFAFTTRSKAALREGTVFPVELNPGEAAFFAVLPHAPGTITLSMHTDQLIPGQDDLHCVVRISTENGTPPSGAHPVELIVRDSSGTRMPMLSRKLSVTGETDVIVPTRLGDPPGDWTVIARDCVTGLEARKTLRALPNPKMQNVPRTEDIVYPSAAPRRIDVNDSEFIALLNALRELYLTGAERDKGALSYYAFDRDVSRHRINQLLGHADWRRKVEAVRNHVAAGNDVILAGEDFGVDPATGLSLDPVHGPEQDDSMDMSVGGRLPAVDGAHRREAITRICGRDVFAEAWPDGRLHVKIGKGTLTLDAVSFDELGQMNGHFLLNHDRWLKTIKQKQR
ncbi:MAG: hypothetical protein K9N51_07895, partial [Candidatus Pacebacteria bacterium]|nr:hypothetical protein [Candidatus Paceibacterota bacterium]